MSKSAPTRSSVFYNDGGGWNKRTLQNEGVMEFIERVERLAYELRNCVRGSYADIGDLASDLQTEFSQLSEKAIEVADQIGELIS